MQVARVGKSPSSLSCDQGPPGEDVTIALRARMREGLRIRVRGRLFTGSDRAAWGLLIRGRVIEKAWDTESSKSSCLKRSRV